MVRGADQSQASYWRGAGSPLEEGHGQPFRDWKVGDENGGGGSEGGISKQDGQLGP